MPRGPLGRWTRPFVTALVAWAVVILFGGGPARAADENGLKVHSPYLRFEYYDYLPAAEPTDSAAYAIPESSLAAMWDGLARGLAVAVLIHERIVQDRRLGHLLSRSPVSYVMRRGGEIETAAPFPSDSIRYTWSLLREFAKLGADSPAVMYTVRLELPKKGAGRDSAQSRLEALRRERISVQAPDSTLTLDWWRFSANLGDFDRPTAFNLPAGVTGRDAALLSGLFYAEKDAERWAARIKKDFKLAGRVIPIRVTGKVLRSAFPPI